MSGCSGGCAEKTGPLFGGGGGGGGVNDDDEDDGVQWMAAPLGAGMELWCEEYDC